MGAQTGAKPAKVNIQAVLVRYGEAYIQQHGRRMTAQQKKTLRAVIACRSQQLGTVAYRCLDCGSTHTVPRPCCNRHCPACGHRRVQAWLDEQMDRLLPVPYFLVTFTVPAELRELFMRHPAKAYRALLAASAAAIKQLAANERHVGAGQLGFFGVLQTWGRDLTYHPHAHYLVAGGAVAADRRQWKPSADDFFVPEKPLAILFRAKLRDALAKAGLKDHAPREVWYRDWTVDSEAVGDGRSSLKYLAPYLQRGPASNWRVTECDWAESLAEAQLVLMVKPSGQRRYQRMPLSVEEFIRRLLQHVLPQGLHRIRYHGFLNSRSKVTLSLVRLLIAVWAGETFKLACGVQLVMAKPAMMVCPRCGGPMVSLGYTPPTVERAGPFQQRAPPDPFGHPGSAL